MEVQRKTMPADCVLWMEPYYSTTLGIFGPNHCAHVAYTADAVKAAPPKLRRVCVRVMRTVWGYTNNDRDKRNNPRWKFWRRLNDAGNRPWFIRTEGRLVGQLGPFPGVLGTGLEAEVTGRWGI